MLTQQSHSSMSVNKEDDGVLVDVTVINKVTSRVVWLLIGMVGALILFMTWQMIKPALSPENNFMSEFVGLFSSVMTYLVGLITGLVAKWGGSSDVVKQQQEGLQKNMEANRKQVNENQIVLIDKLEENANTDED